MTGPAARAAGIEKDHRLEEPVYQQAGWTPVTAAGNNAWSRLMVRLDEMEQSLQFIARAGNDSGGASSQKIDIPSTGMGNGIAHIESPRGTVTLKFHIHEGKLAHMQLNTPSEALAGIIQHVTEQYELADALTAVASLDISPWEIHH
jgi:Ni,Fe-hydrogenase III large subunit